jgi:predicted transcriptional regulator
MAIPKRKFDSPALQWSYDRYIGHDPKAVEEFEEELVNAEIAQKAYDLRGKAGLRHCDLARRVGTTAMTIRRLEDAAYEGDALVMLRRIGEALGMRMTICVVPLRRNV